MAAWQLQRVRLREADVSDWQGLGLPPQYTFGYDSKTGGTGRKTLEHAQVIKQVSGYDADEWEIFTREWGQGLAKKEGYHEVKRLGGAGDHGRDVIGLCSSSACAGVWDNYQCKNYGGMLQTPKACEDAGKIIFHAFRGVFTPPRKYRFISPKGPSMALRDLLLNPSKFRAEVIGTWDVRVAGKVVDNQKHLLTGSLADYVNEYDFETFGYTTLDEMLDGHRLTAFWTERFKGLLPKPNPGVTPASVAPQETVYVGKLLDVYAEETGARSRLSKIWMFTSTGGSICRASESASSMPRRSSRPTGTRRNPEPRKAFPRRFSTQLSRRWR